LKTGSFLSYVGEESGSRSGVELVVTLYVTGNSNFTIFIYEEHISIHQNLYRKVLDIRNVNLPSEEGESNDPIPISSFLGKYLDQNSPAGR
jgi:hypothetical protein